MMQLEALFNQACENHKDQSKNKIRRIINTFRSAAVSAATFDSINPKQIERIYKLVGTENALKLFEQTKVNNKNGRPRSSTVSSSDAIIDHMQNYTHSQQLADYYRRINDLKHTGIRLPKSSSDLVEYFGALDTYLTNDNALHVFGAICPDYNPDFSLGEGISPSASAYMHDAPYLLDALDDIGFKSKLTILLADTEIELSEALYRLTGGDKQEFDRRCRNSINKINEATTDSRLNAVRFREFFATKQGLEFYLPTQHCFERQISADILSIPDLDNAIRHASNERFEKYELILGRSERHCELSIRYAAQYMVFSALLREMFASKNIMFVNYESPNIDYFNGPILQQITKNINPKYAYAEQHIPITRILLGFNGNNTTYCATGRPSK